MCIQKYHVRSYFRRSEMYKRDCCVYIKEAESWSDDLPEAELEGDKATCPKLPLQCSATATIGSHQTYLVSGRESVSPPPPCQFYQHQLQGNIKILLARSWQTKPPSRKYYRKVRESGHMAAMNLFPDLQQRCQHYWTASCVSTSFDTSQSVWSTHVRHCVRWR